MMEYSTKTEEQVLLEDVVVDQQQLIIFNDDVNTFDFVIECLIKVCDHDPVQAEQCTYIIHYKGKCSVKTGAYQKLEPMCKALFDKGLTVEIQ